MTLSVLHSGASRPPQPDRDLEFLDLLRVFRRHGGLVRDDAPRPARGAVAPPIRFEWGGAAWLPRFQFAPQSWALREDVSAIVAELDGELDGWALTHWFGEPNAWLADERPVDRLGTDPAAVHAAARADRFVARW